MNTDSDSPEGNEGSDPDWDETPPKKRPKSTPGKKQQGNCAVQIPRPANRETKTTEGRESPKKKRRARRVLSAEEANHKLEKSQKDLQRSRERFATLRTKRLESDARCERLREKEMKAKNRNAQLEGEIEDLEVQNIGLKEDLQKLQAEQVERLGKRHTAHNDRWVITALEKIFDESRKWSKAWTQRAWTSVDLGQLQRAAEEPGKHGLIHHATPEVHYAIEAARLPVWIVVNKILNEFFCSATFKSPFASLGKLHDDGREGDVETALDWVIEKAKQGSLEQGSILRANILRALGAPVLEERERDSLPDLAPDTQDSIRSVCNEMVSCFLGRFETVLGAVRNQKYEIMRRKQLQAIFEASMALSTSLATQNPEIQVCFLPELADACFSLDHPQLRAHRAMGLKEDRNAEDGLDPDDIDIDGQPIDMVIEPMVVRSGNEDGENYQMQKILKKAEVWMVKDADLPPPFGRQ
ncbi:hypothetical protein A1O1_05218 [Capronia coronata CBS 617.96]|uniref:Uncharacterized protein n=1 Tax=Capronia coronata CBS 617.96 TaxID=1182541 RepID=W9Y6X5_9EURO|nr:uncharacterized protein A1O1_05218 [Capronia coronata CBS 617.96]EXJ88288.1 hypothetical protein A1O1_05218 [Capronia coronata CBS 617.96]